MTCVQGGGIQRGRWIPVQATASGRRKYGSEWKAYAAADRPPAGKNKENERLSDSRYHLPIRSEPKGKRPHNLRLSVLMNIHNAGKVVIWQQPIHNLASLRTTSFQYNLLIH